MASPTSIQAFMEMASAILLNGHLEGAARPELVRVAAASGLTEAEMELVVEDLAARQIIMVSPAFYGTGEQVGAETTQGDGASTHNAPPNPPAMQPASPTYPPNPPARSSSQAASVDASLHSAAQPSIASAPPLPPPPMVKSMATSGGEMAAPPAPPLPPPAPISVQPAAPMTAGITPPPVPNSSVRGSASDAASRLPAETDVASVSVAASSSPPSPPASAPASNHRSAADPVPAAPPTPQRQPRTPSQSFTKYLDKAIPQLGRAYISIRSEAKLVEQGVAKLGLSEPYATELLRQVADELETPMLSRQSTEDDPRFETFRERAALILSKHRGMNARSRMLLTAMGEELGLNEEELDQAMTQLTGAHGESLEEEKRASFGERLRSTLEQMPDSFITAPIHDAILEDGIAYEGLSEAAAKQVLAREASAANVAIVDRALARQHVLELLSRARDSAEGVALDLSSIHEEARLWGLSDEEFSALIEEFHQRRSIQRARERRVLTVVLACSCLVVVTMAAVGIWLLTRPSANEILVTSGNPAVNGAASSETKGPAGGPVADGTVEGDRNWSDPDFVIAVANLRKHIPPKELPFVEQATAVDVAAREAAMKSIIAHYIALEQKVADADGKDDAAVRAHAEFLRQWFRSEPRDEVAKETMTELLDSLPKRGARPPKSPKRYEADFQRVGTIVHTIALPAMPEDRTRWLRDELGQRLGSPLDREQTTVELEQRCKGKLAVLLYENLIDVVDIVGADDGPWEPFHWALSIHLDAWTGPGDSPRVEQLQQDYLIKVLIANKEPWEPYEELIRKFAYSKQPSVVMRMAGLLESESASELKGSVARLLCMSIGEVYRGQEPDAVLQLVRTHFNGGSSEPGGRGGEGSERLRAFITSANSELAAQRASPAAADDSHLLPLSQAIVRLARLNTLGCLALGGEAAGIRFDSLSAAEPPRLRTRVSPMPEASLLTYQSLNKKLADDIIAVKRSRKIPHRAMLFQQICKLASPSPLAGSTGAARAVQIQPDARHADLLAEYLVDVKVDAELQQILVGSQQLANWPHVSLALADKIRETLPDRVAQVEQIVVSMVGEVPVPAGKGWSEAMAEALLANAAEKLDARNSGATMKSSVTETQSYLQITYQLQAEARGLTVENADQDGVAKILARLIQATADELSAKVSDEAKLQWLSEVSNFLKATEHSPDELQRFVWRQRAWLRTMCIELSSRSETAATVAQQIETDLETLDRQSDSVWEQVRDGELALLSLWLAYASEVTR